MAVSLSAREHYVTERELDIRLVDWLGALRGLPGRRPLPPLGGRGGLVLLDLQRLFIDPRSPAFLPGWEGVRGRCAALLAGFRAAGRPVLWTRHVHSGGDDGGAVALMGGRPIRPDDPLSALHDDWTPLDGEKVVEKSRYSLAERGGLEAFLPAGAVAVLAGVVTHRCVLAVAVEASSRDLPCVVAADATASTNERMHESALAVLAGGFAYVASVAEILAALGAKEAI